jgi:RNA polymerase sigma-70 factor (ECF subfamily)
VSGDDSTHLQVLLDRMNAGDGSVRQELFACAYERLRLLARRMLRQDFPRLEGMHGASSVLHQTFLRLFRSIEQVHPPTVRDFFRFASSRMRCVLIDLARKRDADPVRPGGGQVPRGHTPGEGSDSSGAGASHYEPGTDSEGPARLAAWSEFHRRAAELPEGEREVFELVWYQGLTQAETARVLSLQPRTVSYRYKKACLRLADQVQGFENFLRERG